MKHRRRPSRFAGPLAKLGIQAGLSTSSERAAAVGCSRSHLLHCERGATMPGYDLVDRMSVAYGVSVEKVEVAANEAVVRLERRVS